MNITLAVHWPKDEARGTVTVTFTDLDGSETLMRQVVDPWTLAVACRAGYAVLSEELNLSERPSCEPLF